MSRRKIFKAISNTQKMGFLLFNDVMFDIAGGKIRTNGSYEFDTTQFSINSEIENCDANTLVTDILGTKTKFWQDKR